MSSSRHQQPDFSSIRFHSQLDSPPSYPPQPSLQAHPPGNDSRARQVPMPDDGVSPFTSKYDLDAERAMMFPDGPGTMPLPPSALPDPPSATPDEDPRRHHGRPRGGSKNASGSWDLLAGLKRFEHSYEEFDTRNASAAHLTFAEGDMPRNRLSRLYHYLINVSIVARWILFIVPVLALLWIPGILGLTTSRNAEVCGVKLIFWSIWLSVVWVGWWAALAFSMILPHLVRSTIGIIAVASRRYIDWLDVLHRYVALFGWMLAVWVSFRPLILGRRRSDSSNSSKEGVETMAKLLLGFWLCICVLVFEKFAIQWIAGKFHERSYAERITAHKFAVRVLVTLYRHSSDIPGYNDALKDSHADKRATMNPKKIIRKALKGVRKAATTTTTALGNVASEIAGSSVLQPNSPQAMVQTALGSANKSRLLAHRLFYSFTRSGSSYLTVEDLARFFQSPDEADAAFAILDKDCNGDASRDEVEMACLELHREQLSIENSMRDLDSAVGRLDNIFMSIYFIVAILIIAIVLETQLVAVVTGAGTLILGLSWLVGGSLTEVLTSIIFLFIKHPYDVGDRVMVSDEIYIVKEIRLLSTIFLDSNSCLVQAPNTKLNESFVHNMRRSPQMSETFTFDVAYSTTFDQIESLRESMVEFLKAERRDYQPAFDVIVVDIPGQEKMTLRVDIKYKSNWQQWNLKAKRRNKWMCALKLSLAKVKVHGPGGDPDAPKEPTAYTLVPYEDLKKPVPLPMPQEPLAERPIPAGYTFADPNTVMMDDSVNVFGDAQRTQSPTGLQGPVESLSVRSRALQHRPTMTASENIEMRPPRAGNAPLGQV